MSSKVIVLVTAVGCVIAAGAGSYLAVRTSAPASAAPSALAGTPQAVPPSAQAEAAPAGTREPRIQQAADDTRPQAPALRPAPSEPTRSASAAAAPPAVETPSPAAAATEEAPVPDESLAASEPVPAPMPSPAADLFEVVEVPSEAVLGIRIDTPISTETSKVEDRVVGRLTRDVSVEGRVVIRAGAEVHGTVTLVERGGRVRERARLGVRFTSLVVDGRARIPIDTEPIFREGDAKAGQTTARVGASAVIGGIIGGVLGGKRGAAIGSAAGAAGGTAVVMADDRSEATLAAGTNLTVRLSSPVAVTVDRP